MFRFRGRERRWILTFFFPPRSLLWRSHERSHPHPDVPVLRPGLLWTQDPEVPVVEEVPDHHSDGEMWLSLACEPGAHVRPFCLGADLKIEPDPNVGSVFRIWWGFFF